MPLTLEKAERAHIRAIARNCVPGVPYSLATLGTLAPPKPSEFRNSLKLSRAMDADVETARGGHFFHDGFSYFLRGSTSTLLSEARDAREETERVKRQATAEKEEKQALEAAAKKEIRRLQRHVVFCSVGSGQGISLPADVTALIKDYLGW